MGDFRIEQAATGRSRCRRCGKLIAAGEHRFGQDSDGTTWFHLVCAAEANHYAFVPFAAQAEKLLRDGAASAKPPAVPAGPAPRDARLEATLQAHPDDDDARRVFADHLLAHGDVWGELLALEHAGENAKAEKHFKKHAKALTGGLAAKMFQWKRGFIDEVVLDRKRPSTALQQLDDVCQLRTVVLLRSLRLPFPMTAELARAVAEKAPASVRALSCSLGGDRIETWSSCFDDLAMPRLETLTIFLHRQPRLQQLAGFFANPKLPSLRTLEMYGSSSPGLELRPDIVDALLTSPLLRQLTKLDLHHGSLDAAGLQRLEEANLPHLERALSVWS